MYNLQAICDSDMAFTDAFAGWPSSVHDSRVFRNSPIYDHITRAQANFFPEDEYLLADKAYPVKTWLMCPYKENQIVNQNQRRFNTKLSATRSVIERSFALLKGRFRRLKFLDMDIKYIPATVIACCVLHNVCLKESNDDFIHEGMEHERTNESSNNNIFEIRCMRNDEAGLIKRDQICLNL